MIDLSGRTILISGVARGQGRSHALAVARAGGRLLGVDICGDIPEVRYPLASKEDLDQLDQELSELGAEHLLDVVDVRDEGGLHDFVARAEDAFGPLDGVVANAGVWDLHPDIWEVDNRIWSAIMDVNLNGSVNLMRAAAPSMIKAQRGAFVFIGSVNSLEPHTGTGAYVVAKHALIGLMRQAAVELAPHNIRANAVCPGVIDTRIWNNPMGYERFGENADRAGVIGCVYGNHLLAGRSALPSSAVTDAVMWLLSDGSEHVTGVTLPVDAGHLVLSGFNHAPQRTGDHAERNLPPAETPR